MYYLLPNLPSARRAMQELLLARIEERHIHFLARRDTPMDGLHEASVLQKTDLVHGAYVGLVLGAILGAVAGSLFSPLVPSETNWHLVLVIGATAFGSLFGAWVGSMVGCAVPNSQLRGLESRIDDGMILLMIDVPKNAAENVAHSLGAHRSEALVTNPRLRMPH